VTIAEAEFDVIAHEGDHRDWTSIYRAFAARLLSRAEAAIGDKLGRRVDAQDVVQSAFRTLIRRASDPQGFIGLPPGTDLWRLLLVITLNKIRKAGSNWADRLTTASTGSTDEDLDVADVRNEAPDMRILRMTVEEQLERVDRRTRRMLILHLSGMSIDEIAAKVDRAPRTVYRAIDAFQTMLEPLLYED
jgi:DNA-directed RNA polymerase specialized sigma24 family protein